jgi:hypothetical protein
MDKIEYRAVIKFFVKEGLTPNEIHSKFIKVYGDPSPSFSTIKKLAAEFKRGRTSLEDDARPQKCFGNGKIKESAVWLVGTSTLFPRFGSLSLTSVSSQNSNSSSLVSVFLRIKRRLQL